MVVDTVTVEVSATHGETKLIRSFCSLRFRLRLRLLLPLPSMFYVTVTDIVLAATANTLHLHGYHRRYRTGSRYGRRSRCRWCCDYRVGYQTIEVAVVVAF